MIFKTKMKEGAYQRTNYILRVIMKSGKNDVSLRANRRSGKECLTRHCQPQSKNIGDKIQTEKMGTKIPG